LHGLPPSTPHVSPQADPINIHTHHTHTPLFQPSQWRTALRILEELDQPPPPPPAQGKAKTASSSSTSTTTTTKVRPDLVLVNVAMDVLAKAGRWEECLALLRSLPSRGLLPDAVSFNTAAHACARAGRVEGALGLLCGMAAAGVPPNARTLGAALDACRRAGAWEAAVGLLGQMAPPPATTPTTTTIITEGAGEQQQEQQQQQRAYAHVTPGVVHYSVAADACLAAGQVDRATALLQEMTAARGLHPDLVVYTSLAREEGRLGRVGRVTALVGEMEEAPGVGIVPDGKFFAAALEGAARGAAARPTATAEGVVGVVREVLGLMKARGLSPSLAAHTAAVRALVGAGRAKEAWHLFKKARAQGAGGGRGLDLRLYTAGLTALAREGRAAEAKALVEEMAAAAAEGGACVRPDVVCQALVMEACCRAGRYAEAMAVLRGPLRCVVVGIG
jgi:pentatricopeptide repeat protein